MSFARDLKNQLIKSLEPGKENPLTTIGLSSLILELGLKDDELFEFCQKMARSLLVHFHEDRQGKNPVTVALQMRFSAAFTALKDRTVFDAALREFREQKGSDASEANVLIRNLREHTASFEKVRNELRDALEENQRLSDSARLITKHFLDRLKLDAVAVRGRRGERPIAGLNESVMVDVLTFRVHKAAGGKLLTEEQIEEFRQRFNIRVEPKEKNRVAEGVAGELRAANCDAAALGELVRNAFQSDEFCPQIHWNEVSGFKTRGFQGLVRPNEGIRPRYLGERLSSEERARLNTSYRTALHYLHGLLEKASPLVKTFLVYPEKIRISSGNIGDGSYRSLGCFPQNSLEPSEFDVATSDSVLPNHHALARKLLPVMCEYGLLVTTPSESLAKPAETSTDKSAGTYVTPTYHLMPEKVDKLSEQRSGQTIFSCNHIILSISGASDE